MIATKTRELGILSLILLLSVESLRADSATWNVNPDSGDWNTAANWTPATVPNGPADTAIFGQSNTTSVALSATTEVNGIMFNPSGSAFTVASDSQELTISGTGITNNSGINQNFVTTTFSGIGMISFIGAAKAGNLTVFTNNTFATTQFFDHSTADSGTIINLGSGHYQFQSGITYFRDNSSAGNGTFVNNGGSGSQGFHGGGYGGYTTFLNNSTAANGAFTNHPGTQNGSPGHTSFDDNSSAGNGTFTNNGGGSTYFLGDSNGGTAKIRLLGGSMDIRSHNAPGMTIGSIEGNGTVFLAPNRLKVGSNNLSTTFSGGIENGEFYETGGSLEKIGSGTLTLSGTDTYDGGTLISAGTLEVTRDGGLGTGDIIVTTSGATLRLQGGAANNYIADTAVVSIVSGSTVDLNFNGTPDTVLALVVDGVVQPAGLYGSASSGSPHQLPEFNGSGQIQAATAITPTPTPMTRPTNLSTRLLVGTGNDVGIGGFIVTGSPSATSSGPSGGPRRLLLRGIGPSLSSIISNALPDPSLQLRGPTGFKTLTNNNWRDRQGAEIIATGRPPGNDLESAIVADLAPGAYTAILAGEAGTTGVGLVEIFDLTPNQNSRLSNLSTRGNVGTGDGIVIAGFILDGATGGDAIIVRGLGPSLSETGVSVLPDPKLELRDSQGALIASDDNWMDDPNQAAIIQAGGLAPSNDLESAIAATLMPGEYTALLSGVNNGTGIGLVEVYDRGAPAH